MIVLSQYLDNIGTRKADTSLEMTAEQRLKSRQSLTDSVGQTFYLQIMRGTILVPGNYLTNSTQDIIVAILAQPEQVITVTTKHPLLLMKAAYHLGNRHIPLEITPGHLRLNPDPVLATMLEGMGLTIQWEVTPFYPEVGAYHSHE